MCGDGAPPRPAGRSPATTGSWTLNGSMKKRKLCDPNGNESMNLETLKSFFCLTGVPPIAMLTGNFWQGF
jgi:hypothetical protein